MMDASTSDDGSNEDSDSGCAATKCHCTGGGVVPAVSNFAIQYNYSNASIATQIMLSHKDLTGRNVIPDYPEPEWVHEMLHSGVFIGSIVGMLLMGYLGDIIGIKRALIVTNSLIVIGALSSALLSWGTPETVWSVIVASRFLLGVGVGGNYPLSAAKAGGKSGPVHEAVRKAGRAFFWQGPGILTPYLVALVLLKLPPVDYITSYQFRILLGLGAVPAAFVLWATLQEPDVPVNKAPKVEVDHAARKAYFTTLLGTAGTWFFFDIAYYGLVLFAPDLLHTVFGDSLNLTGLTMCAALIPLCGTLGTICGILLLQRIGAKRLNLIGLLAASLMFLIFWAMMQFVPDAEMSMLTVACIVFALLCGGPNLATYVLPVMSFPPELRSTYHGRSGAAGKFGAMLGCFLFTGMTYTLGTKYVLLTQAVVCVMAALMSQCLIKDMEEHLQEVD